MSAMVYAWTAGWFLALGAPEPAAGNKTAEGDARGAPAAVDRQANIEEAEGLSQEAWALWQQQEFADAAAKFERSVELDPDAANSWNGLGWARFNAGDAQEAEQAFLKCVELEPKHPAGLNGLGQLYLSQREYKKAEPYFKKAAPNAPAAWYGLGRLYLLTGKYAAAATWLKKAAGQQPADPMLQAMIEAAESKTLSDDLRRQIEPAPREVNTENTEAQRGWALFNQGKLRSAEPLFRKALAKEPENLAAMNGMGFCLLGMGKPEEAKPYFEKCLEIEKNAAGPMNGLARCLQAEGNVDEAVKVWERMQKLYPGPNAATVGLAAVYSERGEHRKAVSMYETLLKASPDDAELKQKLDTALQAAEENADATSIEKKEAKSAE